MRIFENLAYMVLWLFEGKRMAKRKFTGGGDHVAVEGAEAVYIDACAQCIPDVADSRDLQTIRSRVKDQGLCRSYRLRLPKFCKHFERSLEVGCRLNVFPEFSETRGNPFVLEKYDQSYLRS
jgi:hypothetical protein